MLHGNLAPGHRRAAGHFQSAESRARIPRPHRAYDAGRANSCRPARRNCGDDYLGGGTCRPSSSRRLRNLDAGPSSRRWTRHPTDGPRKLHGSPTKVQHDDGGRQSTTDRVLVPLAMPLLAGPGAITKVLTLSARVGTWGDTIMLLIAVVLVGATIALVLLSASRLGRVLGVRGQRILLRFMGLILAALGAEVLLSGVYTFVPRF